MGGWEHLLDGARGLVHQPEASWELVGGAQLGAAFLRLWCRTVMILDGLRQAQGELVTKTRGREV